MEEATEWVLTEVIPKFASRLNMMSEEERRGFKLKEAMHEVRVCIHLCVFAPRFITETFRSVESVDILNAFLLCCDALVYVRIGGHQFEVFGSAPAILASDAAEAAGAGGNGNALRDTARTDHIDVVDYGNTHAPSYIRVDLHKPTYA